jgi:hypothetical protein
MFDTESAIAQTVGRLPSSECGCLGGIRFNGRGAPYACPFCVAGLFMADAQDDSEFHDGPYIEAENNYLSGRISVVSYNCLIRQNKPRPADRINSLYQHFAFARYATAEEALCLEDYEPPYDPDDYDDYDEHPAEAYTAPALL